MLVRDGSTPPAIFPDYLLIGRGNSGWFDKLELLLARTSPLSKHRQKEACCDTHMQKLFHQTYSFDEFTLDVTRGELLRGHDDIKLRPKSFEVLKYLVENNGRLISKDELIHAIWIDTTVTDDSLVKCLGDIRHALHDEEHKIIKTVPGRGYRFDKKVIDNTSTAAITTYTDETACVQVAIESGEKGGSVVRSATRIDAAGPLTRLMVLPFHMLRADRDVDFLAFSVPDAVASALSVINDVVVLSPASAMRYADEVLDLKRIAQETRAEAVLTGTILKVGNGIRVACKLLETRSGTLRWWHEPNVTMSDLFELQDNLVRGIVESLSLSLGPRDHDWLMRDVPTTPQAYEFYLRGNELSRRGLAGFSDLTVARDLYQCGIKADPNYAPAWAQLGRCYRLIGKGMKNGRKNLRLAESAFQRSLELNGDLLLAHSQYAFLQAELGSAKGAMARLLDCAQTRSSISPDLFVALVLCCRFCGLHNASLAAHQRARQLDPQIATSVSHTHYQLGEYDSALHNVAEGAWAIMGMTLGTMGRTADGLATFRNLEERGLPVPMRAFIGAWRAMLEGNREESLNAAEDCIQHYLDPEGVFYMGLIMAHLGESERALTVLGESMNRGFSCIHVLLRNQWFDSLRSKVQFTNLLKRGEVRLCEAEEVYRSAGGQRVLDGDLRVQAQLGDNIVG